MARKRFVYNTSHFVLPGPSRDDPETFSCPEDEVEGHRTDFSGMKGRSERTIASQEADSGLAVGSNRYDGRAQSDEFSAPVSLKPQGFRFQSVKQFSVRQVIEFALHRAGLISRDEACYDTEIGNRVRDPNLGDRGSTVFRKICADSGQNC